MYVLQSREEQFLGYHFFTTSILNPFISFRLNDTKSHILGLLLEILSVQYTLI